ncbi:MAG: 50S ribosomal protein L6 [Candidatus Moranbacteria bacterium RIFCSPHIGHO2_02_FULL_40_12b]|nr:MAG: 50S ribosomal protein L6 [Candidatus Moranbacteria bacterium RIFCSPHIGHO2_02_FULL_40_12b]OGI22932.1 MAG: 50S ribosomal protein L6 [Candidatus Moranbacteria bacterium RIFCSPHIGHO2_12_FULL_40_10]
MSRIGKKIIIIPEGVKAEMVNNNEIKISGPKGSLGFSHHHEVKVKISGQEIIVENIGNSKKAPAIWGTSAILIKNMIEGVSKGYQKQLELNGVGFRMAVQGKSLNMALGFSHPVVVEIPEGIEAKIEGNIMTIAGIDKQKVGQFAAEIKLLKPVEPYKGKGFRYVGEVVRKKEGKKAVTTA